LPFSEALSFLVATNVSPLQGSITNLANTPLIREVLETVIEVQKREMLFAAFDVPSRQSVYGR